jgi:hypothetical protein
MTALQTILFMLFVPGLLLVGLPVWLMQTNPALFSFSTLHWPATPFWGIDTGGKKDEAYLKKSGRLLRKE